MALGGGTFVTQNKELPGAYINFISAASATATLSDRGIVTMPLELDWGVDGEIFEVTNADFQKNCMKIFGYDYTHTLKWWKPQRRSSLTQWCCCNWRN